MKKIEYAVQHFNDLKGIIICPYCKKTLKTVNNSLICCNNHTFDISKKGSVVLYKTSKLKNDRIYDNDLFINRRNFIKCGFYDKLHDKISEIIKEYNVKTILDMGSGEGTHDYRIINRLNKNDIKLIGIDLSKDGIDLSNDFIDNNYIGIVGDLNQLPIRDNKIDLIMNILSPSNESEMSRVLKKNGIIIKVTPKKEYLYELRKELNIKDYENENIIDGNIKLKYDVLEKYEVIETHPIDKETLTYLNKMTPLLNNIDSNPSINEITIALNIYVLRIKDE